MGISVIINTYNAEKYLNECLKSVKDFDEIVICDMHSTDNTISIAEKYGCKIVYYEKVGFAEPARNFAIQSGSQDWVLIVDSDEIIPKELKDYLYGKIKEENCPAGIRIPRKNRFWGKFLEVQYPDYILRFGKKTAFDWPPKVHAHPEINGEVYTIPKERKELAFLHYTSDSIRDFVNVINKYTDLEVEKMAEENVKLNVPLALWKSIWLIFEKFLLKKGYKDGTHGLIMCSFWGGYKFLAQIKYWEYLKNKKEQN